MNTMLTNRNSIVIVYSASAGVSSYNDTEFNNTHTQPILTGAC